MKPKIVFTGGGTAGHVIPNLPLIEAVQTEGWQVDYIGLNNSIEQHLITKAGIAFHAIHSGKLRRYFSWQNFIDPVKILCGIIESYWLLKKLKTDIVFSKGGFVAFPVVIAAWLHRIPVIAHESDISPGLANRLSLPFIDKICVTFAAAKAYFKKQDQVAVTGTPIRQQLFNGSRPRGLDLCGFSPVKPCILVMGGSLGAENLNLAVRQAFAQLTDQYQIIHLCGKGKVDTLLINKPEYCQFEYVTDELADLLAASDVVVSRAGANAVSELLALHKLNVLVPLSAKASRGDQIQNAAWCQQQGVSIIIQNDDLNAHTLIAAIENIDKHKLQVMTKIKALAINSATSKILAIIKENLPNQLQKNL